MNTWLVHFANKVVIVTAFGREAAKGEASKWIGGNPDGYIVEPLTNDGDQVHFSITTYV